MHVKKITQIYHTKRYFCCDKRISANIDNISDGCEGNVLPKAAAILKTSVSALRGLDGWWAAHVSNARQHLHPLLQN